MDNRTGQIVNTIPKGEEKNFTEIPKDQLTKVKRMSYAQRKAWLDRYLTRKLATKKKKKSRSRNKIAKKSRKANRK